MNNKNRKSLTDVNKVNNEYDLNSSNNNPDISGNDISSEVERSSDFVHRAVSENVPQASIKFAANHDDLTSGSYERDKISSSTGYEPEITFEDSNDSQKS